MQTPVDMHHAICKQLVSIIYDHFLTIKNHGPKDEKGNVYYTCPNCMEKSALMLQIEDLHNHIEELNRNISKLTLRNLEQDIDDLSVQFAGVALNVVSEEIVEHQSDSHQNNTSVWTSSDESSRINTTERENDYLGTLQSYISSTCLTTPSHSICSTSAETEHDIELQESTNLLGVSETELTSDLFDGSANAPKIPQQNGFHSNQDQIETLLIGDSNLTYVNIGEYRQHNKVMKVVHPNTTVKRTHQTTEYLELQSCAKMPRQL